MAAAGIVCGAALGTIAGPALSDAAEPLELAPPLTSRSVLNHPASQRPAPAYQASHASPASYGSQASAAQQQGTSITPAGGLKWRPPQGIASQRDSAVQHDPQVAPVAWVERVSGQQKEGADSQRAVNLQPIHPISDPFGERVAQLPPRLDPPRPAQPAPPAPAPLTPPGGGTAPPFELEAPSGEFQPPTLPNGAAPELPAPAAPRPMAPVPAFPAPGDPELQLPMPEGPRGIAPPPGRPEEVQPADPMFRQPAPPFAAPPFAGPPIRRGQPDCDRIYNQRNFCEEDAECRAAIRELASKPLSAISLDITPPFDPTAPDATVLAARMEERLSGSEGREWVDRQGRVLATGRLREFSRGEVLIEQANGQTARVPHLRLNDDSLAYLNAWWGLPNDCRLDDSDYRELPINEYRQWHHPLTVTWTASALCHKPLYFEEVQLERYGHTTGLFSQPVVSAGHFFVGIASLPYQMGMDSPWECKYALGHYRPGNCAPWYLPAVPISPRGALAEAGVVTGLVYLIP